MVKKKILVVDDEPGFVKALKIRLKHWGYDVVTAYNTEQCFQTVEKEQPDLVLLDILMPGTDGVKCCDKLTATYNMPVIMVTALADLLLKSYTKLCGAFEYVVKPINDDELKSKIEKAFSLHKKKK